jgi:hypothetical protein
LTKKWPTFLQANSRHPETVEEAVNRLMLTLDDEQKLEIAHLPEEDLIFLHLGLGLAIRNGFGLHDEGSKLLDSCKQTLHPGAFYHPVQADDASGLIIKALWSNLGTL